jgi:hypothetical protein
VPPLVSRLQGGFPRKEIRTLIALDYIRWCSRSNGLGQPRELEANYANRQLQFPEADFPSDFLLIFTIQKTINCLNAFNALTLFDN